jgi:iron complex outermembrane receptor protein
MNKIILGTLIWACLCVVGLTAQTQEEQSDIEVIVTASRVEEPAEEVPAYVSVITAEDLSGSGQTTLVEALDGLAGIHFRSYSSNAAQAEVSMRGFGENSHGRVLVLVDGRRLNRPDMASINWLEIPVENIERVEVVRGGSSVLYGDNAVAGVINIITKKGVAGFDVAVSGQYGSYNQNQEGVEVSGSSDLLSYSITGEHTTTDGYRDRSAFRSLGVGGSVGLDLERFSSGLSLLYNRIFYEMPGSLTKAEFDADPTQAQPGHDADEALGDYINADLSLSFSPTVQVVLDGKAGYRWQFVRTDFTTYSSYTDLTLQSAALTPKLKLHLPLLNGNDLVVGIDGFYDQADLDSYDNVSRITNANTLETRIRKSTLGLYATDDLQILPVLTASAGLRYELAQISAKTLKTTGTPIDDSKLHQAFVYDFGLLFRPAPEMKLWAGFGTVFRYPFVDEQVSMYGSGTDAFYTDLDPERGYNIEAGLELSPVRWLRWVASGYLLEMTDEIAAVETAPWVFVNVNQDKTRHLGAETEIVLSIPRWAELTASYAFTYAVFREGADEGNTIPLVPAHQSGAKLAVHLPLDLTIGLSGQYISEQYSGGDTANALEKIAAYFLMDAFLRYQADFISGDLDVYFGVNNLLDTTYAITGYSGSYYPGEGRNWKVGASYRY